MANVCPELLYTGTCHNLNCSLKHDAKFCSVCAVICAPAHVYDAHVKGRKHRTNLSATAAGSSTWLKCPICNVVVSSEVVWFQHLSGARHRTTARNHGLNPSIYPTDAELVDHHRCFICKRSIHVTEWRSHLRSQVHTGLQRAAAQRSKFEQAERDRGGIVVSHAEKGVDFGVVSRANSQKGVQVEVTLASTDPSANVSIVRADTFSTTGSGTCPFSAVIIGGPRVVAWGKSIYVRVTFLHPQRGRFFGRLELTLQDTSRRQYLITRQLRAVVGNASNYELLKAVAPYVHRRPTRWHHGGQVMEGRRPPALDAVMWVKTLEQSYIPAGLQDILKNGSTRKAIAAIRGTFLPQTLINETHERYFRVLLWLEEHRLREDLRLYDLADVQFAKEGRLYTLPVPGLAEKRPSVVIGDTIHVQSSSGKGHTHKGFVHDVRLDNIRVNFHSSFNVVGRYNVRFEYNRTPIKRQHQTLMVRSTSTQRLLFPGPQHTPLDRVVHYQEVPLSLFNGQIANNAPQLQAVKSILRMKEGAAPFIVFGPPGTGKTVTIIEAIRQILHRQPNAHILACAPSNSAADLLAQRLSALTPAELLRCNAIFRDRSSLPDDLVAYSTFKEKHFSMPPISSLVRFKIIVSTCGHASFPYNLGMPHGHFTHIFVDEAGQGTEPEVLTAAIKTLVTPSTRVILSGDPKQLGPVIRSSLARQLGLGKSYLERLMDLPLYNNEQTGRGRSYIKLVKNFRSHKAILDYPNERFYNGELEVCGSPTTINSFLGSSQLPKRTFPIIFHAISGENERESSSPSYFNIDEATEVVDYVEELLRDRSHPVRAQDIGIITPYFAQSRKIRKLLQKERIEGVKVASVEEFQGQERRVIIISTVRSSRDLLSYDAKFSLGFVSNPRRFNVAVTRAQALLIVIGDAYVLSIDPMWRGFMNYVYLRGGWRGDAPTWDTNVPVRTEGDYAAEMQEAAAAEMDALMARLTEGEDIEGEANIDQAFQEAE
ncbi:P-loop containing nucleoside triphosphate hydrolase protein [Lentinus tigrinus ALCF2SS1-7]|uniref:RNA helicase n=1 Tax=Lentinus tigrinus ALCF2SS1-6 TaxID=1328759 RepID=A0A5C2RVW7_9APHY|nr:P-loop containing nucleoside triphosphate hydrolase protein [Lentinus tigrinus ALCF2SS1-6]RPD72506.1 P-loop containing nucleoside triphosphate hydrolase protein [Lentinus tigrinus ALCF2SS1-7]